MLTIYRMDANPLMAASGAVVVPVTVLLLNYRGFASIDGRFASLERRLEVIERDLKEFYKPLREQDKQIIRLKDHIGLK